jgi:hypothetical protein
MIVPGVNYVNNFYGFIGDCLATLALGILKFGGTSEIG